MEAIVVLALAAAIFAGVSLIRWNRSAGRTPIGRRDQVYAELPPGVLPPSLDAPTRPATRDDVRATVAVRFEPPQGVAPEQVGVLTGGTTQGADIAAALVGLAVDGHLHLQQVHPQPLPGASERDRRLLAKLGPQWLITAIHPPAVEVAGPMRAGLWQAVTALGRPAMLTELKPVLTEQVPRIRLQAARNPQHRSWYPAMRHDGSFATFGPGASRRTALGAALRYQSAGFHHFLETADGNRLRFEGGAGIFSRFLPWAIAYGVTDQWVGAFKEACQGLDAATAQAWAGDLAWYGAFGDFDLGAIGELGATALTDLAGALDGLGDSIGDLVSDFGDAGGDSGGGDGGGDGGGGGD